MLIRAFIPNPGSTVADNWKSIDSTFFDILFRSFWIAIISTIISFSLAYPFAYFLSKNQSQLYKFIIISLITIPMWMNLLVKLIGFKITVQTLFTSGSETVNHAWTIAAIVYIYFPIMVLPLIVSLSDLPRTLIEASYDLGRSKKYTFFHVTVPWTKAAIISSIILVFMPAMTSVSIPEFMNQSSKGNMIGSTLFSYSEKGFYSPYFLSNASSLGLVVALVMLMIYLFIQFGSNLIEVLKKVYFRFFVRKLNKKNKPDKIEIKEVFNNEK
jgi:spermidine/putrescine transport system permease protein